MTQNTGDTSPRVTVVTPSYNQAEYLEQTILSVLDQDYPNLEYIVIDGGSTDGSVEIIKRYADKLAYWVSERDRGQADAINKGFARATGDIMGWLNSDDLYDDGCLQKVVAHFVANPGCQLVYGHGLNIDETDRRTTPCDVRPFDRQRLISVDYLLQPATFWRRLLWERVGPLRTDYHWGLDWDWFIRASQFTDFCHMSDNLALYRSLPETKTGSGGWRRQREIARIARHYGGPLQPTNIMYLVDTVHRPIAALTSGLPLPLRRTLRAPTGIFRILMSELFSGRFMR